MRVGDRSKYAGRISRYESQRIRMVLITMACFLMTFILSSKPGAVSTENSKSDETEDLFPPPIESKFQDVELQITQNREEFQSYSVETKTELPKETRNFEIVDQPMHQSGEELELENARIEMNPAEQTQTLGDVDSESQFTMKRHDAPKGETKKIMLPDDGDFMSQKELIENGVNVNLEIASLNKQDDIISKDEDGGTMHVEDISFQETLIVEKIGEETELESTEIMSSLTCDENSIDEGFPYARPTICEMSGEITINSISSLVAIRTSQDQGYGEKKIRPYARKDDYLLPKVKEITVKPIFAEVEDLKCSITHEVPAIIFSVSGYTGNFFHDMADVLIPLFLTSHQFNSEVQFFVTNYDHKWVQKYLPILDRLSRYHIVNLDRDKNVHCVKHAFIGLYRDHDLIIHPHPTRNPKNYSMIDFTKFLGQVYALKRSTPIMLGEELHRRPRMLIISRKGTRRISNIRGLVRAAKELGFEVVVSEASGNIKRYAQLVNSCDVMLAVHGAGLTNQIFLPPKAVVIQVVPWGKMDWMATNFYGQPAIEMDLKYLEYSIKEEESSLIERYPRDHVVFKDPYSIHLQGWDSLSSVIMAQNVKLNLRRFREILLSALDLLHE